MITDDELKQLQHLYLDLAEVFHNFCLNHDLTYYMGYGTALGEVRHRGFIPWDLDIDVMMFRNDYENFGKICLSEGFHDGCSFASFLNQKDFFMPHSLIYLNDSEICFENSLRTTLLFLDIFPIDSVPDSLWLFQIQKRKMQAYSMLMNGKRGLVYKDTSKKKRISKCVVKSLLRPISFNGLNAWHDKEMQRYNNNNFKYCTDWIYVNEYPGVTLKKEVFGTPQLLPFEDRLFYFPQDIETYLESVYGDYMTPPSIDERESVYSSIRYIKFPDCNLC